MIGILLLFLLGLGFGYLLHKYILSLKLVSAKSLSEKLLEASEKEALNIREKANREVLELEKSLQEKSLKQQTEFKLKEQELKAKLKEINQQVIEQEKKEKEFRKKAENLQEKEKSLKPLLEAHKQELERIANLKQDEAKAKLFEKAKLEIEQDIKKLFLKRFQEAEVNLDNEAKRLLLTALFRISQKQVPESSTCMLSLPDDALKAKIIGRDGKNIRAFEEITGVTVFIDDTPKVVFLTSFDPKRRHIAKETLSNLLQEGKINPQTIEGAFLEQMSLFEQNLITIGAKAAKSAQVRDLHPEILKLLGKLQFLSSFQQNVLQHSLEVSHLMGAIASELKLDEMKAREIGLLHDIGKALPAEAGLSHALTGKRFALQYGVSEDIANGIGCHHDEITPLSHEAALCKVCDRISAVRLGARIQSREKQDQKLSILEEIAREFHGVERAYALHAGREVQVIVKPDLIDDVKALDLAKEIAKKIEVKQPSFGKVQITVIREKRYSINYHSDQ